MLSSLRTAPPPCHSGVCQQLLTLVDDDGDSVDDRYLTTEELASRYRTSPGTVRFWRHAGKGPKGVKFGRRVLYAESEVARWDAELRGTSA